MKRKVFISNTPLDEARAEYFRFLTESGALSPRIERRAVEEARGRHTAEVTLARRSSPHYQAAAMDGIAVRASDTFGASESRPVTLTPEQFTELDTGDYIPPAYDAVIMIEDVDFTAQGARLIAAATPWQHVRSVGEDLVEYDIILPDRSYIGPVELACLKNAGVEEVDTIRPPLVGIIPTGTELVKNAEQCREPGAIIDTNSLMLAGLCEEWGAQAFRHPIVPDDRAAIRAAVETVAAQADIVVLCSGSSAGTEDYSADTLAELGRVCVHGLAIRPGKPAILAAIGDKPALGVPGYPVSAHLIANLFLKPIIERRRGQMPAEPVYQECQLIRKLNSHMGVDEFVHVSLARIGDGYKAYPLNRGAGLSSLLVKSDGVLCVERGVEGYQAGEKVTVALSRPRRVIDTSLVCIGSHDITVDILIDMLWSRQRRRMISNNAGSMGGLMALMRQETHLAGIHLLDTASGSYNLPYLERSLKGRPWLLVNLVKRRQGFIVAPGNPQGLQGIEDLARLKFINRQKGSGTRILLDYHLQKAGIGPQQVYGYEHEEYSHLAVAAAVKSGICDVGLGIYSSARIMGLDFIPLDTEQYDLCLLPEQMEPADIELLLEVIRSDEFRRRAAALGGYELDLTGAIVAENR